METHKLLWRILFFNQKCGLYGVFLMRFFSRHDLNTSVRHEINNISHISLKDSIFLRNGKLVVHTKTKSKLEPPKTSWNHLEQAGTNQNEMERDGASKD